MRLSKSYQYPIFILAILFFVFGFITWVNGILIPYFQICLELSNFQSLLVAFSVYIAYFVMSLPSAWVLKMTGYKKAMVLGLILMATGTFLFIPAAYFRTYPLFLFGLFVTGSGLSLLQTAANPYIAIIGPPESTAQRIGLMGLSNKIAGILSQRILGAIFLVDADAVIKSISNAGTEGKVVILENYILKVIDPYLVITGVLLLLSIMVFFSGLPEVDEEKNVRPESDDVPKTGILQYPYLVLGILALFVGAACEVIPVDGIIIYSRSLGIPLQQARHFAEYTLYAMLAGYLTQTILIPKYLTQQNALAVCGVLGIIFSAGAYFTGGMTSVTFLILMGFAAAWVWGPIWGLAIRNLGRFTKTGSALLLMSVIGGGIFPLIFGALIDKHHNHPQVSVLLLVPCYSGLLYYATHGYKLISWRKRSPEGNPHAL